MQPIDSRSFAVCLKEFKENGLVKDVFSDKDRMASMTGAAC